MPFARSTFTYETPSWTGRALAPTPAPVLRKQRFRRDEETCGALQGGYTDSPPVCSGSASFCTFTSSSGYQGCCQDESSDSCTFYTTCYAYSDQASCTGPCTSSGLVCPSSAPECTQYTYQWEPNPTASSWTGFACGSQQALIYAFAVNGVDQLTPAAASSTPSTFSASSSSSSTSYTTTKSNPKPSNFQSSSSLTLLPPPTGPSSITSIASTAVATTSSATEPSVSHSQNKIGVIAGSAVGGIAALIILSGLIVFFRVRHKRNERSGMASNRELGRPWPTQ